MLYNIATGLHANYNKGESIPCETEGAETSAEETLTVIKPAWKYMCVVSSEHKVVRKVLYIKDPLSRVQCRLSKMWA